MSNSSANKKYDIYLPSKNGRRLHHEISKNVQVNFIFFAGQSDTSVKIFALPAFRRLEIEIKSMKLRFQE